MNKLIHTTIVATALSLGAFAESVEQMFTKPNSGKGFVAIVNQQTKVDEKEFTKAVDMLRGYKPYMFKFVKTEDEAKDAAAILLLVDKSGQPPMTVSPEVGRAEVNVAGLCADLKSEAGQKKFLPDRARREFIRAFAFAFCAGGSQFPGNIMTATSTRDLDYLKDPLPVDTIEAIGKTAKKRGLEAQHVVDYITACEEGWAPKPVTEQQKKDWDEVHQLPTKPIKILPPNQKK